MPGRDQSQESIQKGKQIKKKKKGAIKHNPKYAQGPANSRQTKYTKHWETLGRRHKSNTTN